MGAFGQVIRPPHHGWLHVSSPIKSDPPATGWHTAHKLEVRASGVWDTGERGRQPLHGEQNRADTCCRGNVENATLVTSISSAKDKAHRLPGSGPGPDVCAM